MTWTLAIDTSGHATAGLAHDGVPVDSISVTAPRRHGEELMPSVLELCASAQIALQDVEEFVVGMGPGPFTGLRVGIVTAWTLAELAGREPHGVCSLDAYALQWNNAPDRFIIASDARRKELYWAEYHDGARVGEPRVGSPSELPPDIPVAGSIPEDYLKAVNHAADGPTSIKAAVLAARWRELSPAGEEPYYLRPADAQAGAKPKPVLPRLRAR